MPGAKHRKLRMRIKGVRLSPRDKALDELGFDPSESELITRLKRDIHSKRKLMRIRPGKTRVIKSPRLIAYQKFFRDNVKGLAGQGLTPKQMGGIISDEWKKEKKGQTKAKFRRFRHGGTRTRRIVHAPGGPKQHLIFE